ncbi:MAG: hypothetical protein NWQ23_02050 [Yoonia sp.]|uniref:hypothetical protein n=1 Tax=Yoonia sp. TaxID=2212373 RepID=UPI00273FBE1E|nr:hypothetical protein [Yoonia sp.]MDP5084173.1 hypothetical protein [Yoonia sp.]
MGRDWIIDVLADLRAFAHENDLPLLAAQLEEAGLVAEVELAQRAGQAKRQVLHDATGQRVSPIGSDRGNRQG